MLNQVKKWMPFKRGDSGVKRLPAKQADLHPLARMERDLQHLLDRFGFGSTTSNILSHDQGDSWFGDFSSEAFLPSLDLADKRKYFEVSLELPGMGPDDVEIDVRDGILIVRGEKSVEETSEDEGFYRTERSFGSFERAIPLPAEVDVAHTEASFKKGVLKVKLPKAKPETSSKKITIKAS